MESLKICRTCHQEKLITQFYNNQNRCKECAKIHYRDLYRNNAAVKQKRNKYQSNRYQTNTEYRNKCNARSLKSVKKRYHNDPEYRKRQRDAFIKRKYAITPEQYAQLLIKQDNKCAICYNTFKSTKGTHIDHAHGTGTVRGVLCRNCNTMLGYSGDSITTHLNAIKYLKRTFLNNSSLNNVNTRG